MLVGSVLEVGDDGIPPAAAVGTHVANSGAYWPSEVSSHGCVGRSAGDHLQMCEAARMLPRRDGKCR